MKRPLYFLIMICFTSCFAYYTEYTYKLKRNDSRFASINDISISVDLFPTSNKYNVLEQTASGPYRITIVIRGGSELLDNIEIDNILLIMKNKTINLFNEDLYIYNSSLGRNYYENEKTFFLSSKKIEKLQISSRDYILIGFNNVEIIYKDIASFEIVINIKLQYHDNSFESKEIRYKFFRKKSSEILLPTT